MILSFAQSSISVHTHPTNNKPQNISSPVPTNLLASPNCVKIYQQATGAEQEAADPDALNDKAMLRAE